MSNAKVVRPPDVLFERVGEDTAVLDPATGRYTRLNGSASLLWELLASPTTAEALAARLVREFGIDAAAARRDVDRFLEMLRRRDLIVAHGASAGLMIRSPTSRLIEPAASRARRAGSSPG
jgi:hypothetical protein